VIEARWLGRSGGPSSALAPTKWQQIIDAPPDRDPFTEEHLKRLIKLAAPTTVNTVFSEDQRPMVEVKKLTSSQDNKSKVYEWNPYR